MAFLPCKLPSTLHRKLSIPKSVVLSKAFESISGFGRGYLLLLANPASLCTTGFWVSAQKPEIIIFGLKFEIAHQILRDLFRGAKTGVSLPTGIQTGNVFGNASAFAFPVARRHYHDYLGWSNWFYAGDSFPCLQLVWPDRAGLFLGEPRYEQALAGTQLDLTEDGWLSALAS